MIQVVIQSRMNSRRLPGKALLPVRGIPTIVLCAKRAANRGHNVTVATSTDPDDDIMCETLAAYGITFFRGSLNNVFERYYQITNDLLDEDVVVRLTADNLFPDGAFINNIVDEMHRRGVKYFRTSSPVDRLPYGMSVETFTVKALRCCKQYAVADYDKEHVTPAIQRTFGSNIFIMPNAMQWNHLRCTIDFFSDYQQVCSVFENVDDPVSIGWFQLCEILAQKQSDGFRIPFKVSRDESIVGCMTLGTAQLGIDGYGIANDSGGISESEVTKILKCAIEHGVTSIDSARAYEQSESRIGKAIQRIQREDAKIITKLDPLSCLQNSATEACVFNAVDASIYRSCYELKMNSLHVLLLHRWKHRFACRGDVWRRLLALRNDGVIEELGASVSTPAEAMEALRDDEIKHLQIPFNLLDKRWLVPNLIDAIKGRSDVTVYTRSAFLQGLLLSNEERWPKISGVDRGLVLEKVDKLVVSLNRKHRADLCLAYVRSKEWVDSVVIGVDSLEQLKENLFLMMQPPLIEKESRYVEEEITALPDQLLDPAQWG